MIKLEALRVFMTVAEIGNIRDAADRLGRTPSAVSMTLKQIEEEIGAPLFESDRKNALTALGRFTLEKAQAQVLGFDKAVAAIRAFAHHRIGTLTLACVPSVAARLMPDLLSRFVAAWPGVDLELFDVDSVGVAALVESGQADIGLAGRPRVAGVLDFAPLFRDRFRLVCASNSRLATLGRPAEWQDLAGERLIRNGASEAIDAAGYRALAGEATLMLRNVTSLLAMVGSGLGVTLLPALSTAVLPPGVTACDLADGTATREVGVIERKAASRSPVATAFLELLHRESPAHIAALGLDPC